MKFQKKESCLGNYLRDAITNSVETGRTGEIKNMESFFTQNKMD